MATVRIATGALLDTVTKTATAAGDLVGAVGSAAGAINDFAENFRRTQQRNIKISSVSGDHNAMVEHGILVAASHQRLNLYIEANPHQEALMQTIMKQMQEALA